MSKAQGAVATLALFIYCFLKRRNRMKTKLWLRMIAMLLSIILFMQLGTTIVFAEETPQNEATAVTKAAEDNPIIGEVTEMRDATTKYFLHQDRKTITAARYPDVVHYQKDNQWLDIDNTMIAADSSANGELKPTTDHFFFRLGKKSNGHILTLGEQDEQIKFNLLNSNNVDAITHNDTVSTDDQKNLDNVTSSVLYEEVFDGVDLRFDIGTGAIKDNFILEDKDSTSEFQYKIIPGKNTLISNDDGSISVLSAENTEIYRLSAPLMYDSAGNISYNIAQTLTSQGNNYILSITPDRNWLEQAERAYPVTVDPAFYISLHDYEGTSADLIASANTVSGQLNSGGTIYQISPYYDLYMQIQLPAIDVDMYGDRTSLWDERFFGGIIQSGTIIIPATAFTSASGAETDYAIHQTYSTLGEILTTEILDPETSYYDDKVINYLSYDSQGQYLYADITRMLKSWYSQETPHHALVISADRFNSNSYVTYEINFSHNEYMRPAYILQYASICGLEDYYSYTSATIEAGGVAYVNNATGELCYSFWDHNSPNTLNGMSICHIYNDTTALNGVYNYDDDFVNVGQGFRLNIQESLVFRMGNTVDLEDPDYIYDPYNASNYLYSDGDGTIHFFVQQEDGTYLDESGLKRTVSGGEDGDEATLTYEDGTRKVFNYYGHLIKIIDTNENWVEIIYDTVDWSERPIKIIEHDGTNNPRHTDLIWEGKYLKSIRTPDGAYVNYTYTAGKLVKAEFTTHSEYLLSGNVGSGEKQTLQFSYATENVSGANYSFLSAVRSNVQNGRLSFTRNSMAQVSILKSTQQSAESTGEYISAQYNFTYKHMLTMVKEPRHNNYYVSYVFDNYGRAIIINDRYGNSLNATYNDNNRLTFKSDIQTATQNLYKGGSADSTKLISEYLSDNNGATIDTTNAFLGAGCVKLLENGAFSQTITVPEDGNYVFGAYVNSGGSVSIAIGNTSETLVGTNEYEPVYCSRELTAGTYTFTITNNSDITVAYIDNLQVLRGYSEAPFNLLQNPGFLESETFAANTFSYWESYDDVLSGTDGIQITEGNYCLKLTGQYDLNKRIRQFVNVCGEAGDTLVFGGRINADMIPYNPNTDTKVSVGVRIYYTNNGGSKYQDCVPLQYTAGGWQVAVSSITAEKAYDRIVFVVNCSNTAGTVFYDDLFVYENAWGTSYNYDTNGHLDNSTNSKGITIDTNYNEAGDLISSTDALGNVTNYQYYDTTRNFKMSIDATGYVAQRYDYDSAGNTTASYSENTDGTMHTRHTQNTYRNKLFLMSTTDASGNETKYQYHTSTLNVSRIQSPNDTVTKYTYYEDSIVENESPLTLKTGPLQKTTVTDENGNTLNLVQYQYHNAELSKIIRGKLTYNFASNYGANENIIVAGENKTATVTNTTSLMRTPTTENPNPEERILSKNYFDNNGNLLKSEYAAGGTLGKVENKYDSLNRLVYSQRGMGSNVVYDKAYYNYQYDNLLSSLREPLIGYTTRYLYDELGNVTEEKYTHTTGTGNTHTYTYNDNNWVTQQKTTIAATAAEISSPRVFRNTFSYNASGLVTTQYNRDASAYVLPKINYHYDSLNRPKNNKLSKTGTFALTNPIYTAWIYADGATEDSGTTYNISEYRIRTGTQTTPDFVYGYTYDSMGNVTKITNAGYRNSTGSNFYSYDALNQLTSAKLYLGNNITYTESFEYEDQDDGEYTANYLGNIAAVTKNGITYTYTYLQNFPDVVDYIQIGEQRRTFYRNDIGNTLSDGKHTFTWEGRRLSSATTDGVTATYDYNIDGLRVKKTLSTGNTIEYFYNGSGALEYELHTANGIKSMLYYTYGRDGVELLTYIQNYGTANETTQKYWYMKNAQGDITGLVKINTDGSATVECLYYYSSFGELLRVTDVNGNIITNTAHIAHINPIRYRGYYYDTESALYYVTSRYYDPEICRFISADSVNYLGVDSSLLSYNLFAFCMNNPINRSDDNGNWSMPNWLKITIGAVALAGAIAFTVATGGGAAAVAVGVAKIVGTVVASTAISASLGYLENGTQGAIDGACDGFLFGSLSACAGAAIKYANVHAATTGTSNSMGKVGEGLAGIDQSAKQPIQINGRTRIPDALTNTTLKEVKNVKYLSNTQQLRDFAAYANNTGRSLELWVRPTTRIAKPVIDAGWNINYLW